MKDSGATACFLCGSTRIITRKYLRLDSSSRLRNAAYALPFPIASRLAAASKQFASAYRPVAVNRKYFDRHAVYCLDCYTGRVTPALTDQELSSYYRDFYWSNRDIADGQHLSTECRPNDRQLALTGDRFSWLARYASGFGSVIDFGAGDCAAAYEFLRTVPHVHVVDPSERARDLAAQYGATYTQGLKGAPTADLFYSAHSIEHVSDLAGSLTEILGCTKIGGYVFFETPNIGDAAVFLGLGHTPHTYMLSSKTFGAMQSVLPVRIVVIESCGPEWRTSHPRIGSNERADLRVLLQKTGEVSTAAHV